MMIKSALTTLGATALLAVGLLVGGNSVMAQDEAAATATSYKIDAVHSSVTFAVLHNGMAFVHGRFNKFDGKILWNEADLSQSAVHVDVETASIDTNNEGRDRHLRSADFFDAEKNQTISFRSKSFQKVGDGSFAMTGDLTLNGVTKEVKVPVTNVKKGAAPRGGERVGGSAEFTIKRSDFGMTYGIENGSIGDEVRLILSFQGAAES